MAKGCPKCGRIIDENLTSCPYCNYDFKEIDNFFKKIDHEKFLEEEKYAGFIKRLVAGMIDIDIILLITYSILILINNFILKIDSKNFFITVPIFVLIYIFLCSIMERTPWHASLGKYIVGIEVADEYENPITFGAALLRNTVKFLNLLTLGIGFLICVSPPKKQTLSDKITKTYVLNKVGFSEEKKHDYASMFKRLIAFIIDIIIIGIIIYIINYICNYITENFQNIPYFIKSSIPNINMILNLVAATFYFPFNESRRGKTIGKKYLKIKLTSLNEDTITFLKAFVREILLSIDILTLGFLLPFSHKRKQTVKDILTKTIIINE